MYEKLFLRSRPSLLYSSLPPPQEESGLLQQFIHRHAERLRQPLQLLDGDVFLAVLYRTHIAPIHIKRSANVALRHFLLRPDFLNVLSKPFTYQHNCSILALAFLDNLEL